MMTNVFTWSLLAQLLRVPRSKIRWVTVVGPLGLVYYLCEDELYFAMLEA